MAYNVVGLDIGARNIRVVLFERTFREWKVVGTRQQLVPLDEEGNPTSEGLAAAIHSVMGELKPGEVTVVCGWPATSTSMWFFPLPFVDQKRIVQTVMSEVEDLVPFELSDMMTDWRILRNDGIRSDMFAALARRDQLKDQLGRLAALGIDPMALVLDAEVLKNALPSQSPMPVAFVDMGHNRTLLGVVNGGVIEHLQAIPRGGRRITEALMQRWNLSFSVAEYLKHHGHLPPEFKVRPEAPLPPLSNLDEVTVPLHEGVGAEALGRTWYDFDDEDPTRISQGAAQTRVTPFETPAEERHLDLAAEVAKGGMDETTEEMIAAANRLEEENTGALYIPEDLTPEEVRQEIRRALDDLIQPLRAGLIAYEADKKREVSALTLMGGGSRLEGISDILEEELGVGCRPVMRLGLHQSEVDEAPEFALAFALGLRGVTDGKLKEINFRKEDLAWVGDSRRMEMAVFALAALLLISIVGGAIYSAYQWKQLSDQLADLDSQLLELVTSTLPEQAEALQAAKNTDDVMAPLLESHVGYQERGRSLLLLERPPSSLDVLLEVSENLSPGFPGSPDFLKVDIDEYVASDGGVKLKGATDSFDSTGKIEASLKKNEFFSDVTMGELSSARGADDKKTFNLSVTVKSDTEPEGG